MASEIFLEEYFAPEVESESDNEAPPPKRFCTKGISGNNNNKLELEKIALKRIIEFEWDDSDKKSESSIINTSSADKLEERIRYLQLDLANAKLEIIEFQEKFKPIQDRDNAMCRFNAAIATIEKNVSIYQQIIPTVGYTPFAELIRQETEQIKTIQTLDLNPLSCYLQEILMYNYLSLKKSQIRYRDELHARILFEKSKANTIVFLKIASVIVVIQLLGYLMIRYILRM